MYARLQRLGVCLSHTATILAVKKMGINHDKTVQDWTDHLSGTISQQPSLSLNISSLVIEPTPNDENDDEVVPQAEQDRSDDEVVPQTVTAENKIPIDKTVSIIGDNLDKNINPWDIRVSNQVKSIHHFHSVATVGRVKTLSLDDEKPIGDIRKVPVSAFLPSAADCASMCDDFVVLAARIITDNFLCFASLRKCVPDHIDHKYSAVMKEKTISVSSKPEFNAVLVFPAHTFSV